jgi:threonine aldolase
VSELLDRYRAAAAACDDRVVGSPRRTPAQVFARLAEVAEELGLTQLDRYAEHGAVELLEREVAELFGRPAAVFFPTGTAAQQSALRVWCERRGSRRVALPDLAHQLHHEEDGPRLLHGFRFEPLTTGWQTPTVADLDAVADPERLGAIQLELPLREAGCVLPTWEELVELSDRARALGVPLHVDGARIWESQPHLDHTLAEIGALTDSLYVSFYKGLGALSGAAVVCDEDVAAELRVWRKRHGATPYALSPYAVDALRGLREELPYVGDWVAWARALADALVARGLRTTPVHTNTFLVAAEADPDTVTERVLEHLARTGVVASLPWRPAQAPGTALTEVVVARPALAHDPETVAEWYATFTA